MYPVTEGFKEQVSQSHRLVTKAEILSMDGVVLYDDLVIETGFVHDEKDAANRRRCNVFITNTKDLTPADANDLLHPLSGNVIKLYRGLHVNKENRDELVPLGVFNLEDCNIEDNGEDLRVEVKGFDRSKTIQRNRWTQPYQITSGTNIATAIKNIITDRLPGVVFSFMETTATTPTVVLGTGGEGGGDPWADATKLADSIGAELFFDAEGVCVLRPEPDPASDPVVWHFDEGPESIMLYAVRNITREEVYNHVIAVGNHSALFAPIRAEAKDTDPNSPTYIEGPFGRVPTWLISTTITSQTQAQEAADARLRKVMGTPEQARIISVVNPAHTVGDVVEVTRKRAKMERNRYVIEKVVIPMEYAQPMNAIFREKRIASA